MALPKAVTSSAAPPRREVATSLQKADFAKVAFEPNSAVGPQFGYSC